jgi:hypothetical protein
MEIDHDEEYAGEHVMPGASFVVFRDEQGWFWEAGEGLPPEQPHGPFKRGLDAYRAAVEMYEATFGESQRR